LPRGRSRHRPPAPSTQVAIQDEVGIYRQKLEEAYRALDDAYAQITNPEALLATAFLEASSELASVARDASDRMSRVRNTLQQLARA
jgi:hypothetical protein